MADVEHHPHCMRCGCPVRHVHVHRFSVLGKPVETVEGGSWCPRCKTPWPELEEALTAITLLAILGAACG